MEGLTSLLKRTTIKGAYLAFPDVGGRQVLLFFFITLKPRVE